MCHTHTVPHFTLDLTCLPTDLASYVCSTITGQKEQLQTQLADVEALRITPLYKSIDELTAVIAARDSSIAEQQGSIEGLQVQIAQLEHRLETKRGKKQAYKIAFVGKVHPSPCASCPA